MNDVVDTHIDVTLGRLYYVEDYDVFRLVQDDIWGVRLFSKVNVSLRPYFLSQDTVFSNNFECVSD